MQRRSRRKMQQRQPQDDAAMECRILVSNTTVPPLIIMSQAHGAKHGGIKSADDDPPRHGASLLSPAACRTIFSLPGRNSS